MKIPRYRMTTHEHLFYGEHVNACLDDDVSEIEQELDDCREAKIKAEKEVEVLKKKLRRFGGDPHFCVDCKNYTDEDLVCQETVQDPVTGEGRFELFEDRRKQWPTRCPDYWPRHEDEDE